MTLSGGCLCGRARYTINAEPLMTAICHCRNCQRQSGSAFSIMIGVASTSIEREGFFETFVDKGESGAEILREFCPRCGSPIFSVPADKPRLTYVKAGTLDDVSCLAPTVHIWTSSAQPWVKIDPAATRFPKNPG